MAFLKTSAGFFFWLSNRRIGGMNLSWIHRMYISDLLGDRGGSVVILSGTCMLDHVHVVLVLFYGNRRFS